jgi:predicted NAD-dependent protein-ADP-ribosyltransferase YbiA (DUF1768 family)
LRVTPSSGIPAENRQSLAENDEAETDETPNKRTQAEVASLNDTNDDDAGAGERASAIEEQDEAAKKAARRAGRIARTARAAIQAKKEQAEGGRRAESRCVTFDVRHVRLIDGVEQDKGYIFFNSGVKRYGGPFAFLSNCYPSEFRVEEVQDHTFLHVEQYYQHLKALAFRIVPEIMVTYPDGTEPDSSHDVADIVLHFTGALDTAAYVRKFVSLAETQHPGWFKSWDRYFTPATPRLLEMGLQAKFVADENLMELLQKTGNYELVLASGDKKLGIGFAADVAFEHRDEWEDKKDCNLLGRALMKVRDANRGSTHSKVFDREFYDDQELEFWGHVCELQRMMRY